MAWTKLTSLVVLLVCRSAIFFFISLIAWIIHGTPNINTAFLTVFLSVIIPLPPTYIIAHPLCYVLSKVWQLVRAYLSLVSKAQQIFITFPCQVMEFILYGCLENTLRYVINHARFTIPDMASKASSAMFSPLSPFLRMLEKLIEMSSRTTSSFTRMAFWMAKPLLVWISTMYYRIIHMRITYFIRRVVRILFAFGAAFVCLPGIPLLINLLVTGNLYPGSLIRFQRCAKYGADTACHALFLEFSCSVWHVLRTGLFLITCCTSNRHAWKLPPGSVTSHVERSLSINTYSQLMLCAAGLPLLMQKHGLSQTIHNVICTGNLLASMVILNGYHRRTLVMIYHGLCLIALNFQSVLVALYNIYRNLQTQRNDSIVTFLYIMELYLMFLVILDSTTRIVNKLMCPEQDILSQDAPVPP